MVHGAWASAPGWDQLADHLARQGYATAAPELGLVTIDADVAIVRATLDAIEGPKLLVAHSYGGVVVSNAAVGRDDVVGLVYTAAYVPDVGDDIAHMGAGQVEYAPPAVLDHLLWTGEPWASPVYIEHDAFREVFAADLSPSKAAELDAGQRPASPALLVSPSGPVAWRDLPTFYAVSAADLVIDEPLQRWMAARAGAEVITFPSASHVGGYTHYAGRFARFVHQAALAVS
nr:alpha/beta hydrolase [Salsipaludibacter albus]